MQKTPRNICEASFLFAMKIFSPIVDSIFAHPKPLSKAVENFLKNWDFPANFSAEIISLHCKTTNKLFNHMISVPNQGEKSTIQRHFSTGLYHLSPTDQQSFTQSGNIPVNAFNLPWKIVHSCKSQDDDRCRGFHFNNIIGIAFQRVQRH